MIFKKTKLKDAVIIELEKNEDTRGFFARSWCEKEFADNGINSVIKQCNISYNSKKGTLRGMHYQVPPHEEEKLVRCIKGEIYDVIIDLRPQSPTYLKHLGITLNEENRKMLFIPKGFAHGFQTMCDDTEVFYHMSAFYEPVAQRGIRWDDANFAIQWPNVENRIISEKDKQYSDFQHSRSR